MTGYDHSNSDDTSSLATFQTSHTSQTIRDTLFQLPGAIPCTLELSLADTLPSNTAIGIDDVPDTPELVEDFLHQEEDAADACSESERPSSRPGSGAYPHDINDLILINNQRLSTGCQLMKADLWKNNPSKLRFILYDPKSGTLEAMSSMWYLHAVRSMIKGSSFSLYSLLIVVDAL